MLNPRLPVPALSRPTGGADLWSLAESQGDRCTLRTCCRGLHRPVCRAARGAVNRSLPQFAQRGVAVVALSSDSAEHAARTKAAGKLDALTSAHGLPLTQAYAGGSYVSGSRGKSSVGIEIPAQSCAPGVFPVQADGPLYWAAAQTMPLARPHFAQMPSALDFVVKHHCPARGAA